MTVKITLEMLEEKDACEGQIKRFKEHFPDGFVFENKDDAIKKCIHAAENFDVMWMADELLDTDARAEYGTKLASAQSGAWDADVLARDKRRKAIALIEAVFGEEITDMRTEYGEKIARAFAKAYWAQESAK